MPEEDGADVDSELRLKRIGFHVNGLASDVAKKPFYDEECEATVQRRCRVRVEALEH